MNHLSDSEGGEESLVRSVWLEKAKQEIAWDGRDRARMSELNCWVAPHLEEMIEGLSERLMALNDRQQLMGNARFARRLHGLLGDWWMGLLDGAFDEEYFEDRIALGKRLVDLGLTFEGLILLKGLTRQYVFELAQNKLLDRPQVLWTTMHTLNKAFDLDLGVVHLGYLKAHDANLERKQLDRFLAVTGFSPTLYESLVEARRWSDRRLEEMRRS